MAKLYIRNRSPFYWLNYRDATGVRRQISTGLRHGRENPIEVRKAFALEADYTAREFRSGLDKKASGGWEWVGDWFRLRYGASPGTLRRYTAAWKPLTIFLRTHAVIGPERVMRQHCFDYIVWRTGEKPAYGSRKASHNSALNEVHIFAITMQEALNRGLVNANPCVRLGVRQHESRRKPELVAEDFELIREEIGKTKSDVLKRMLFASFEIARHQGCRLAETRIHLRNDVDLVRGTITFRTKTRKAHTTSLHSKVAKLVEDLIREGHNYSWDAPEGYVPALWAAHRWHLFCKRIGLTEQGKSFHCLRVTVITRLARAGVARSQAMAFVGHSESATHSIYTRLQPEDLSACLRAVDQTS
jgi:integrase